ncbi:unnamed protein product [Durusdinium trenchii]|uniref:Methyltransferase FkbM domain-containing protein n=1 Tax=Durusdinium trenchii TaxID=1381693 RepID=A0ABP0PC67_9DINO
MCVTPLSCLVVSEVQCSLFNQSKCVFHTCLMEATNVFRVCYSCDDQRASHDTLCLTLFQDSLALSQVDFIKIDAEAMELDVLKGAGTLLRKFKPLLFLEYRNPRQTKSPLLKFLEKIKYDCVLLRLPIFNDRNFRGHLEDLWASKTSAGAAMVSFNLFCKSRRKTYQNLEAVSALFTSAVDTDVEGLKTTPKADPFEVLHKPKKPSAPPRASSSPHARVRQAMRFEELAATSQEGSADRREVEMSLDELMEASESTREKTGKTAFPAELTLDEL